MTGNNHRFPPPERNSASTLDGGRTLIDLLLAEQRIFTAVDKFSEAHGRDAVQTGLYRDLIPLSVPSGGEQFAFEVNLDQCSGCKACVTACHSLNGLDEGEAWRRVDTLISDDWRHPYRQAVTTACHHCLDPACLNGCPVLAYEKDPVTGIVRHLDDQCIGCQYCVLMCPYDVPQYSKERGIVRKCDMCSQRLSAGEAPACVQACPNEAIRITIVRPEPVREACPSAPTPPAIHLRNRFLPGSPDPAITRPTTRYVAQSPLAQGLVPAEAAEIKLQPPHWPLVWMLVLTQMSVGAFTVLPWLPEAGQAPLASFALIGVCLGLAASASHLGRPMKAWRSFLGLRKSWLSREIILFSLFTPVAAMATARLSGFGPIPAGMTGPLLWAAPVIGLMAVFSSVMIYHKTHRPFWCWPMGASRFFGSTALLGIAGAWSMLVMKGFQAGGWVIFLAGVATLKFAWEHRLFRRAQDEFACDSWPKHGDVQAWSLSRSALLIRDDLGSVTRFRFGCLLLGGIVLPMLTLLLGGAHLAIAASSLALLLLGELTERYLFFRAVIPGARTSSSAEAQVAGPTWAGAA